MRERLWTSWERAAGLAAEGQDGARGRRPSPGCRGPLPRRSGPTLAGSGACIARGWGGPLRCPWAEFGARARARLRASERCAWAKMSSENVRRSFTPSPYTQQPKYLPVSYQSSPFSLPRRRRAAGLLLPPRRGRRAALQRRHCAPGGRPTAHAAGGGGAGALHGGFGQVALRRGVRGLGGGGFGSNSRT